jgi:cell division protease FtsH
MRPSGKALLTAAVLLACCLPAPATAQSATPPEPSDEVVRDGSYADLTEALDDGLLLRASFSITENLVVAELTTGERFQTRFPDAVTTRLMLYMLNAGVELYALPQTVESAPVDPDLTDTAVADPAADEADDSFLNGFGVMIPFAIFLGFFGFLWRGRVRARREEHVAAEVNVVAPDVGFDDVAGCEEAVDDLEEIVEFLKHPERFEQLGAKVPRGALLVGPPGTGKTLLAKAVAGEAGVAFFPATGSDFVELYVGVGAKRIRELFAQAKAAGRAIIFIDEIDAIGRTRGDASSMQNGSNLEQENTLIALLSELDGFHKTGVVVIAATNRPDVLDPALTRPGRLERRIHVPNPDRLAREKILQVHTANKPLATDVDLHALARRTPGTSGADLAHIANEAALHAAKHDLHEITQACFDEAVATLIMGRARHTAVVSERDRTITAWHEAGHALAALLEPCAADPAAVSIVPRGRAGGVTWMYGSDDQFLSREAAMAQLVVALSGRVGEELLMNGEFTQGAQSDLLAATDLALQMVTQFGMTDRGLAVRHRTYSGLDDASDAALDELLQTALDRSRTLLSNHLDVLRSLADALLTHHTLTGDEVRALATGGAVSSNRPVAATPRRTRQRNATRADVRVSDQDPDRSWMERTRDRLRGLRRKPRPQPT